VLCVSWAGGEPKPRHQVSAARICLPAWEQIISHPGTELDTGSHINTEKALSWSPKLGSVLCHLLLLQRPTQCLRKAGFIFPCPYPRPFSAAYIHGYGTGSTWYLSLKSCRAFLGGAPASLPGPGKRSSCAGDARNKVPLPVPAACHLHTDA